MVFMTNGKVVSLAMYNNKRVQGLILFDSDVNSLILNKIVEKLTSVIVPDRYDFI